MIIATVVLIVIVAYLLRLQRKESVTEEPKKKPTTLNWLWFFAAIVGTVMLCMTLATLAGV